MGGTCAPVESRLLVNCGRNGDGGLHSFDGGERRLRGKYLAVAELLNSFFVLAKFFRAEICFE